MKIPFGKLRSELPLYSKLIAHLSTSPLFTFSKGISGWLGLIAFLLLLFYLFSLQGQLRDITAQNQELQVERERLLEVSKQLIAEQQQQRQLQARLEGKLQAALRLSQRPGEESPTEEADLTKSTTSAASTPKVGQLKNGLYTLTTPLTLARVRRSGTFTANYTIYHISAPLGSDTNAIINVGLAIGDITKGPQFYVDSNSDNQVDAELIYDILPLIPYSGFIGKTISEDNSQRTYESFLVNHKLAEHISLDEIEQKGSRVARALWSLVSSHSERFMPRSGSQSRRQKAGEERDVAKMLRELQRKEAGEDAGK